MENGELTQWVNFSNQLQTRTRRGDQWSPTNRYDVALHGRPLAAPTVRQYAVRITQRKMPGIRVGGPADLVLLAPEERWTFAEADIGSKSRNTPFLGTEFTGRVHCTIKGGEIT